MTLVTLLVAIPTAPRAKFVAVVLNVGDIVVPLLATTCRWFLGDHWLVH